MENWEIIQKHDLINSRSREIFGKKYIDETRMHRKDAPMFTDKMPNNFETYWFNTSNHTKCQNH